MNEWIKKNNEKVIYGLAILVVILLLWVFSTRSTLAQETARLNSANSTLTAQSAAKDTEIGAANEQIEELTQIYEESQEEVEALTAEIARLTAANGELSEKITELDESLLDARIEIDRLDFVALLRGNNVENLRSEVAILKQSEAESADVIAGLQGEMEAAGAVIRQLEETVDSLSGDN